MIQEKSALTRKILDSEGCSQYCSQDFLLQYCSQHPHGMCLSDPEWVGDLKRGPLVF